MKIYNQEPDIIQMWDLYDPKIQYNDYYNSYRPDTYFNPVVTKARTEFVNRNCDISESFDYGCGMNPFHYNFETETSLCRGLYDRYVEKFSYFDKIAFKESKTLLMFDVLEHIYNPQQFLEIIPQSKVILTLPVFPRKFDTLDELKGWKHFKPGEHLLYCTRDGIHKLCERSGYDILESDYIECPPREDILSLVIQK